MESKTSLRRFQRVVILQGVGTILVFAGVIGAAMLVFRNEIRHQILSRDGTLLTTVAQHFYDNQYSDDGELVEVLLESSDLSGVIAVRLFSPDGLAVSRIPVDLFEGTISGEDIQSLEYSEPIVRHYDNLALDYLFSDINALLSDSTFPVTEVLVPLNDSNNQLVAIIQYWLDGEDLSTELAGMDRFLMMLGLAFFIAGGLIFALVFLLSRKRLLSMGLVLTEQNEALLKANSDLAMAARTSAIGSITGHLFHGLKNPLAGLKAYLQLAGHDEEAVAITDRMQLLIDESLSVIQNDSTGKEVVMTLDELVESARQKLAVNDDSVSIEVTGTCQVSIHKTQLLLLVLRNLLDNAIESAPGKPVNLRLIANKDSLVIETKDFGPGLPNHVKDHLFEPVMSSKENGTGIGLAISSVIARHIPASLELKKSDQNGTTFVVTMPL